MRRDSAGPAWDSAGPARDSTGPAEDSAATPGLPDNPRQRGWHLADGLRRILLTHGVARSGITGCGLTLPRRGQDDGQAHPLFRRECDAAGRSVVAVDNLGWCGSARCPRCGPLVAKKLRERVQAVLDAAHAIGAGVAFVTLTAAHNRSTPLADARRNLSASFTALQQDRAWKAERNNGLLGIVRIWETTDGHWTGWHLHPHGLLIHQDGPAAAVAAGELLIASWQRKLARRGWRTVREAQDVRPVTRASDLPDYGTKALVGWNAAAELAAGWRKEGRRPDRVTLPQLLGLAVAGDARAAKRYAEAVTTLSGQRLFVLGPRLAKSLGIAPVTVTDGEAVEPEKRPGVVLGLLRAEIWNLLARQGIRAWAYGEVDRLTAQGIAWEAVAAVLEERAMRPRASRSGRFLIQEEIRWPHPRPPAPD